MYWWGFILVIFLWSLEIIFIQYSFKFIGFAIDYGLNYQGEPYQGVFAFLFDGRFGGYGSKQLLLAICVCLLLSILLAYTCSVLENMLKTKIGNWAANRYRWEIYHKVRGKKLNMSSGDYLVFLHEDIYKPGNVFISMYPSILVYIISIVYSIIMLGNISPYLIITPVVAIPLLIWYFFQYRKLTYGVNSDYRKADGKLRDSVAQAIASEDGQKLDNFVLANAQFAQSRKHLSMFSNKYNTILSAIRIAIYLVSCIVAGVLVIHGKILIGEYLIFTSFVNTIFSKLIALLSSFVSINSAAPRIRLVQNFIKEVSE